MASRLAQLDLNLLVALDALLAERSVTRAAHRLGLSQPAMSHALARLRRALGDPVLVRARGQMVPTPVAAELGDAVRSALGHLESALAQHAPFDPATTTRAFNVAASDYVGLVLLAPLVEELTTAAPNISIRLSPLEPDLSLADLEEGRLDLTLGFFRKPPSGLRSAHLFDDRLVVVMHPDHPAATGPLDTERFVELPHLRIAPHGERRGLYDIQLKKLGLSRRVVLSAPQFTMGLLVARSNVVTTLPERLAHVLASFTPLVIRDTPLEVPRISVDAYWHERVHHDSAHAWLRRRLMAHAA